MFLDSQAGPGRVHAALHFEGTSTAGEPAGHSLPDRGSVRLPQALAPPFSALGQVSAVLEEVQRLLVSELIFKQMQFSRICMLACLVYKSNSLTPLLNPETLSGSLNYCSFLGGLPLVSVLLLQALLQTNLRLTSLVLLTSPHCQRFGGGGKKRGQKWRK